MLQYYYKDERLIVKRLSTGLHGYRLWALIVHYISSVFMLQANVANSGTSAVVFIAQVMRQEGVK